MTSDARDRYFDEFYENALRMQAAGKVIDAARTSIGIGIDVVVTSGPDDEIHAAIEEYRAARDRQAELLQLLESHAKIADGSPDNTPGTLAR